MTSRQSLDQLIPELASGLPAVTGRLTPLSVELSLPIETIVAAGPAGLRVEAALPQTRTRTDFDRPLSRVCVRLGVMPVEELS